MGSIVTATTFSSKLCDHGITVWITMAFLAARQFAMLRMAERTGLVSMSGLALHQRIINISMTTATDLLWFGAAKGNVQRIMWVGMTAQTIFILKFCTMAFLIMTFEARRDLAMNLMTRCASDLSIVL